MKEILTKINKMIVERTVSKRMEWSVNKAILQDYVNTLDGAMKELNPYFIQRYIDIKDKRNYIDHNSLSISHNIGYRYGVLSSNKLLKENNFNLNSLIEVVRTVPRSYAYSDIYSSCFYINGFISGLFAENDSFQELNYIINLGGKLIEGWKEKLSIEANIAIKELDKEVATIKIS